MSFAQHFTIISKISWRLKNIIISIPFIIVSIVRDKKIQPWKFILLYITHSDVSRHNLSSKVLSEGYISNLNIAGESVAIGLQESKIFLGKNSSNQGILNGIIAQYIDIWYPTSVKIAIPIFNGEGPYEYKECKIKLGDNVIDAGANYGVFTWFAAEKVGSLGKVFAFEPIKSCYDTLVKSVDLSKIGNRVITVKNALSEKKGEALFSSENMMPTNMMITDKNIDTGEKVELISIDEYVKEHNLTKIDFIKADIEGMEPNMLKGAEQTIRRFKPKIAICTYHEKNHPELIKSILLSYRNDYMIKQESSKLYAW